MLESITFKNFRALRDCTLPLGPVTVLVGPNGAGKSSALRGIKSLASPEVYWPHDRSAQAQLTLEPTRLEGEWASGSDRIRLIRQWNFPIDGSPTHSHPHKVLEGDKNANYAIGILNRMRRFEFNQARIAHPAKLTSDPVLNDDGFGLPAVLDHLRDAYPERFEQLNHELGEWLPEFDRILFGTTQNSERTLSLRLRKTQTSLPDTSLSAGTLFALALLVLANDPSPPPLIALEDPDRALHPRLLHRVQEAMYRLAYPQNFGSDREPVQMIATTHSPYFLDLFRDHPEEVVIADKTEDGVQFKRLSERPRIDEILPDGSLGELWYSGIFGGVPAES